MAKKAKKKKLKKITFRCKKCLQDIVFNVNPAHKTFPITFNSVHGDPPHKLIVRINKNYKVESFEINEAIDPNKEKNQAISQNVLRSIGLSEEEIALFLNSSGKGPMTLGEISIINHLSLERTKEIAENFVQKGLFQEIQGATIYYQALPPYAALIDQLEKFTQMIRGFQISTPTDLHTSFLSFEDKAQGVQNLLDFVKYLTDIKINLSKDISEQRNLLDDSLSHLQNQKKIVTGINSLRDQSINLVDEHYISLFNQFELLKQKISKNLGKLQLGVIVKTVDDIVQKSIDNQMEKIRDDFQRTFESKFKFLLDKLTQEISIISENAGKVSDGLTHSFSTVLTQFDETLSDTQNKILTISDSVMNSFGMLRNTFSEKVVITLDDILGKIIDQLDMNISSIREFWEVSKGSVNFTMKDVWFIRTPEGMVAQIDDAVSRAKMRFLIVSPSLSDIGIDSLKKIPNHINVRICCNINPQDRNQRAKLDYLDSRHNVDYRHRSLQNLWAINRDYEEIILGIVNKEDASSQSPLEVAGIGSILAEHIKIFVPILEDAWRGSSKTLPKGFLVKEKVKFIGKKLSPLVKSSITGSVGSQTQNSPSSTNSSPQNSRITTVTEKVTLSTAAIQSLRDTFDDDDDPELVQSPSPQKSFENHQESSTKIQQQTSVPVIDPFSPAMKFKQIQEKEKICEKNPASSKQVVNPISLTLKNKPIKTKHPAEIQPTIQPIKTDLPIKTIGSVGQNAVPVLFDSVRKSLENSKIDDLIQSLEHLHNFGQNGNINTKILSDIANWRNEVRRNSYLDDFKKKILTKKLKKWKKKFQKEGK